ncbi:MAG: hypothetical protein AAGG02_06230 [Cyanobacteria bacterium P01_H01_bin.15]
MSRRYLQSEWCRRELSIFYREAQAAGGIWVGENICRLFKVLAYPIPPPEHPEELSRLLGYEFFDDSSRDDVPFLFDKRLEGNDGETKLNRAAFRLATHIDSALNCCSSEDAETTAAAVPSEIKGKVFLAETFALSQQRDALLSELVRQGYSVVPQGSYTIEQPYRKQILDDLTNCAAAIHLVGDRKALTPPEEDDTADKLQLILTKEHLASRVMVCLSPGLQEAEIQNQYHRQFVAELNKDNKIELLQKNFEEFKLDVCDRIAQLTREEEVEKSAVAGENAVPMVYVIVDEADYPKLGEDGHNLQQLTDFLYDAGFEVRTPDFEITGEAMRQAHEQKLHSIDNVLIYFGAGSKSWLEGHLDEVRRALGSRGQRAFRSVAVYVDGAEKRLRKTRLADLCIRNEGQAFAAEQVQAFVAQALGPGGSV